MDSRIPIPLMGIVHNIPDREVPDGAFFELINLRHKDNVLRPVPNKATAYPNDNNPQAKILFKHVINAYTYALFGTRSLDSIAYLSYFIFENDVLIISSGFTSELILQTEDDLVFSSVGLTVLVSDRVSEITNLFVFKNTVSPVYELLSPLVPSLPVPSFKRVAVPEFDRENITPDLPITSAESYESTKIGEYNKMIEESVNKGLMVGTYLVRCAYELFDGTIVKHTIPVAVTVSQIPTQTIEIDEEELNLKWTTNLTACKLQINTNFEWHELEILKVKYGEYIRAINIYATQTFKPGSAKYVVAGSRRNINDNLSNPNGSIQGVSRSGYSTLSTTPGAAVNAERAFSLIALAGQFIIEDYQPDMHEQAFFLLKSIDLKDITEGWMDVTSEDNPIQDLVFRTNMTTDDFTHHTLFGKRLFSYNDRYFLGDIKNTLFTGFPLYGLVRPAYANAIEVTPYELGVEFDILTSYGMMTVFTGWTVFNHSVAGYTSGALFGMVDEPGDPIAKFTYWGYPDARAKKCRILLRQDGVVRLVATCEMEPILENNYSLVVDNYNYPVTYLYGALYISSLPTYSQPTYKTTYYDNNRIQACEWRNPFYYPAINSYSLEGFILGMATNAEALSQGQFGQYPLFAFTTTGTWALQLGANSLIATITPLNRSVLSQPESLCMISGGVVYISAEGLMILAGKDPTEISEIIERANPSPLADLLDYQTAIDNPNIYQPSEFFDQVEFKTYLQGAKIAWDHKEKEIIVCNSSYNYSFVFGLTNRVWHKITQVWDDFIADYPRWLGSAYKIVSPVPVPMWYIEDLSEEVSDLDPIMVHAETRAIKFGDIIGRKMIKRIMLSSVIDPAPEKVFAFYLFGSVDFKDYYMQDASTNVVPGEDILIGRSSFSCKSFIITFGGWIRNGTTFGAILADVEKRYLDKLR